MSNFYPATIPGVPQAIACWSTEALVGGLLPGFVPLVVAKISGATANIPFAGDILDASVLNAFLAGEPYGKVIFVNNQIPTSEPNNLTTAGGVEPPHIVPTIKIGASAAMLFEGGTKNGQLYGLDIQGSIAGMNIHDGNWTIMAVIRPTSSRYCNQATGSELGDEGGTILSLEAGPPLSATGGTTVNLGTLTNVTPIDGIVPGMWLTSPSFSAFFRQSVLSVVSGAPGVGNIQLQGAGAAETNANAQLLFSDPIIRIYQCGDASPGSFAMNNCDALAGEIKLEPQEFSGCEIRPVVASWTSRSSAAAGDVPGLKTWQNEIVRSSPLISARPKVISRGYVGRMGGMAAGQKSRAGDFYCAALLIWNVALTQAQRAIVTDSLAARFQINERRSIRSAKSVTFMGDSIAADYNTEANYGMSKRLADKFGGDVRFLNYSIPGSNILSSHQFTSPHIYTEGLFGVSVAAHMDYSKSKNVLILLGGGNDLGAFIDHGCTFNVASNEVSVYSDATAGAAAAAGTNLITSFNLPLDLGPGAFVDNLTHSTSLPSGPSLTVIERVSFTQVRLSGNIIGPGISSGDTIRFRYHNMVADERVIFPTLPSLLTGLVVTNPAAVTGTVYRVKTVTAVDKYTLASTPGGSTIDIGGSAPDPGVVRQFYLSPTEIFGTPTTHGLQKIAADAAVAAPGVKVFICTVLPRVGITWDTIPELNALIMSGGAGGYQAVDLASDPTLANHDIPPGTVGPGYAETVHPNEVGHEAAANFLYPIVNAYLSS